MKKILKRFVCRVARAYHADINCRFDAFEEKIESQYLQTMETFLINEKVSQTTDWTTNYKYQYYTLIKRLTAVETPKDLKLEWMRIGRANDGGYLMIPLEHASNGVAYSFGICDDTSWDHDMAKMGYEVYQYDHTIDKLPEENPMFHWEKIGITGSLETDELKELSTLLKANGHFSLKHMILKLDVEGAEWDVFANITEDVLKSFDEIVVEYHGILDYKNCCNIQKALSNVHTTHAPIHVHANNYGKLDFCGDIVMPDVLEVTYINRNICETVKMNIALPLELDMPCCKSRAEICLGNWQ